VKVWLSLPTTATLLVAIVNGPAAVAPVHGGCTGVLAAVAGEFPATDPAADNADANSREQATAQSRPRHLLVRRSPVVVMERLLSHLAG
jgi:hypothetical protein